MSNEDFKKYLEEKIKESENEKDDSLKHKEEKENEIPNRSDN